MVVPLVGTWIEISPLLFLSLIKPVVPVVGTWIEIMSGGIPIDSNVPSFLS